LGCILYELVTLNHPFDANSLNCLVLKILRGVYPAIPAQYSQNLKNLIAEMLTLDPNKRPSIDTILEKYFMNKRIRGLLSKAYDNLPLIPNTNDIRPNVSLTNNGTVGTKSLTNWTKDRQKEALTIPPEEKIHFECSVKDYSYFDPHKSPRQVEQGVEYDALVDSLVAVNVEKTPHDEVENEDNKNKSLKRVEDDSNTLMFSRGESMSSRIETIRFHLEKHLGEDKLIEVWSFMTSSHNDDAEDGVYGLLEPSQFKFIPLIYRLILCEESYYSKTSLKS